MLKRAIPRSGERLPAVGLGTYQTFAIGNNPAQREPVREVLRLFVEHGGAVVDSSPMYGSAEDAVGDLSAELGVRPSNRVCGR
jgi:aryl-alcohol dehydrogenase-like predicted oxidoreductase